MSGPTTPFDDDQNHLRVRRGRVDSVDLYEIKDSELDLLEKGAPADVQLNFAISLLSIAFSSICALATATFPNPSFETIFTLVAIVGVVIGVYFLVSWYRSRTSHRDVCKRIRGRIPADVLPPSLNQDFIGENVLPR